MQQSLHSCSFCAHFRINKGCRRRGNPQRLRWQATNQQNHDSQENPDEPAVHNRSDPAQRPVPWAITFDIRERETIWTDENKARLVQMFAAKELGLDTDMLSYRLRQLTLLLPDLGSRVASMKPALLADVLRDPAAVAERCVRLRQSLPHANVSQMVALQPSILLEEVDSVTDSIEKLGGVLGVDPQVTQTLVTKDPRFLDVEAVEEVLEEMSRLMPKQDPRMVLVRDPGWLLRDEVATRSEDVCSACLGLCEALSGAHALDYASAFCRGKL